MNNLALLVTLSGIFPIIVAQQCGGKDLTACEKSKKLFQKVLHYIRSSVLNQGATAPLGGLKNSRGTAISDLDVC